MIELNSITANELLNTADFTSLFPMSFEYLDSNGKAKTLYHSDMYEWFFVTDTDYEKYDSSLWLGLFCVTENRYEPNSLHISVFEVPTPIRGMGFGSKIIDTIIDNAISLGYDSITLQIREPKLSMFYRRFGFSNKSVNNVDYMSLNLKYN